MPAGEVIVVPFSATIRLGPPAGVACAAGIGGLEETTEAQKSREQLAALEAEHVALESRRQQLDAEIAELESRLRDQTRQHLGVEG
jgi:cell division protein FtsB